MGKLLELRPGSGWGGIESVRQTYPWKYGCRLGSIHDADSKRWATAESDACLSDLAGYWRWVVRRMRVNSAWTYWFGRITCQYSIDCR